MEFPRNGSIVFIRVYPMYEGITPFAIWHRLDDADTITFWCDWVREDEDARKRIAENVRRFEDNGVSVNQEWLRSGMFALSWNFIKKESMQCV